MLEGARVLVCPERVVEMETHATAENIVGSIDTSRCDSYRCHSVLARNLQIARLTVPLVCSIVLQRLLKVLAV